MILSCPACSTRYSVPDEAFGAKGRTVRCAQCAHSWHVDAPEPPEPKPEPKPKRPPHRAYRAKVEERKRKRRQAIAAGSWSAVAACLLVMLGAVWMFRGDIVRALPQTASAYALTGSDVNVYGLTIENLVSERTMDDGEPALSVRADLRNIDRKTRPAPLVRFDLRDEAGEAFFAWTIAPDAEELAPGETVPVAALLVNPPERAADVLMTLTEQPVGPYAETAVPDAAGLPAAAHGEIAPMDSQPAPAPAETSKAHETDESHAGGAAHDAPALHGSSAAHS